MVILIDAEKIIWRSSTSVNDGNSQHIKNSQQSGYKDPQLASTPQWKVESLSSKIREMRKMATLTTSIQHNIGSPS